MADSHFTSNIEAAVDKSTITIAGFSEISATTLTDGTTTLTGGAMTGVTGAISTPTDVTMSGVLSGATSVRVTNYAQIGNSYLFLGDEITTVAASIQAAASALVTTASLKGSVFVSASPVSVWVFTATMTVATLAGLGV